MRTICMALATVALLAGCGDDGDDEAAGTGTQEQRTARQEEQKPSLDEVCAKAARDLEDPRAFEKTLPESPQPNATKDPKLLREAAELRGTKEIVQRVFDAAGDRPPYQEALRALIQELDDAEVTARQDYEIEGVQGRLRTRWQRAEREAPEACRGVKQPS